jgi:hypothetical protein
MPKIDCYPLTVKPFSFGRSIWPYLVVLAAISRSHAVHFVLQYPKSKTASAE